MGRRLFHPNVAFLLQVISSAITLLAFNIPVSTLCTYRCNVLVDKKILLTSLHFFMQPVCFRATEVSVSEQLTGHRNCHVCLNNSNFAAVILHKSSGVCGSACHLRRI